MFRRSVRDSLELSKRLLWVVGCVAALEAVAMAQTGEILGSLSVGPFKAWVVLHDRDNDLAVELVMENPAEKEIPTEKLAHRLTMAGLGVEHVERVGDDAVLEIEVTPHRPDCLNVLGIARETAAILTVKVRMWSGG